MAAKGGEELRFVRESNWRAAEVRQDVVGGDVLRTNALGNLAILFADRTQIRVGRNSTLTVNAVAQSDAGTTDLTLQAGTIWARAARGGSGVDVKTPAAVAAIRGTDWSLTVDSTGKTGLVVLEGVVELKNAQGAVTVRQGEGAVASIGQAPTKFVLVNSNDREQMLFYLTLRDAFNWLPATPAEGPAMRAQRARIENIPPAARKAEDWLTLAETALALDGRAIAVQALGEARSRSPEPGAARPRRPGGRLDRRVGAPLVGSRGPFRQGRDRSRQASDASARRMAVTSRPRWRIPSAFSRSQISDRTIPRRRSPAPTSWASSRISKLLPSRRGPPKSAFRATFVSRLSRPRWLWH